MRCTKCIMPDTKPNINFDENGVCNACRYEVKQKGVDWEARWRELVEIAEQVKEIKPDGYNCLVPVSGGKDSTFQAMTARRLGLTPLCVNVEPCYITEIGEKNRDNLSKLGFDVFVFKPNQKIMPELLKRSFTEDGQPVRAYEFMLYAVPVQMAINYKIPLILGGESPMEYGNRDEATFADNKNIQDAISGQDADHWVSQNVLRSDLHSFQHPTAEELETAGVKSVYITEYVKFDSRKIAEFSIGHGLQVRPRCELKGTGGYWDFEQLDDEIPVVSHLLKYIKYGYGRATDQACRDIRWGYISREDGLKLAEKYDGHCNPDYIKRYVDYIGITVDEFWGIANSFRGEWANDNT